MSDAQTLVASPAELIRADHAPWGDRYVGSAEALIAAGLITADQLPGQPGRNNTMCTFYDGVPVKKGANHDRNDLYLSIKRQGKKFEVSKGVSAQVEQERRAARQAQREIDAVGKREEQKREEVSKRTADDFRENCLSNIGLLRGGLDGGNGQYPFRFSADARVKMDGLLEQVAALMQGSEVVPLRRETIKACKAHLRLAWSA